MISKSEGSSMMSCDKHRYHELLLSDSTYFNDPVELRYNLLCIYVRIEYHVIMSAIFSLDILYTYVLYVY